MKNPLIQGYADEAEISYEEAVVRLASYEKSLREAFENVGTTSTTIGA